MLLSEKWLGPIKTPGRGNALAAKDPGLAAVPMASSNGMLMIGISFLAANSLSPGRFYGNNIHTKDESTYMSFLI